MWSVLALSVEHELERSSREALFAMVGLFLSLRLGISIMVFDFSKNRFDKLDGTALKLFLPGTV